MFKTKHLYACLVCMFFFACKKLDVPDQQTRNYEKEFFNVSPNANPTLLRVIDKIKNENDKYHFVNDFVRREGLPKWDEAMIAPQKQGVLNKDNLDGNEPVDTIILIPIIPDQSGFVKDVLSCFVTSDSIYQALIKSEEYQQFGYEPNNDGKPDAKDISFLFMAFEKKMFNKEFFDITDSELAKKFLGDSVLEEDQHLIINDNGNGNFSAYKVAIPADPLPTITIGGVVMVAYLPSSPTVTIPWWLSQIGMGLGGGLGSTWWLPEGGTGGGGGSAPGGGPGGTAPPTTPGWQVPPCGVSKIGNIFYRATCPISIPDDIPAMLKSIIEATRQSSDDMFTASNTANANGEKIEKSQIIVKNQQGAIYTRNPNDGDEFAVDFRWHPIGSNESLIGSEHTHMDDPGQTLPQMRSAIDIKDVLNMSQNWNIPAFVSFVNCGNVRYAAVIENVDSFKQFRNKYLGLREDSLITAQYNAAMNDALHNTNWQQATLNVLLQLLGSASTTGIGIYVTNNPPDNTNFIKLN